MSSRKERKARRCTCRFRPQAAPASAPGWRANWSAASWPRGDEGIEVNQRFAPDEAVQAHRDLVPDSRRLIHVCHLSVPLLEVNAMIPNLLKLRFLALLALSWLATMSPALAQQWPEKPIRLIVPAPPGGISDVVARVLAEQLRTSLGTTVVVENKPGGSPVVAERTVMNAPPDGYTWMIGPSSVLSDIPLTVKTPYDVLETFTYVAEAGSMLHVLVANAAFPPNNVKELLDYAKRHPRSVSVANLSVGTRSNLLAEMLREKSGNDMLVVPYKGSAPAMVELLGNQVQLAFDVVSNVVPLVKSGKLKGLAVASSTRSQYLPDVPTFGEIGLPDFVLPHASVGVFVLSRTPKPLVDRIQAEVAKVVHGPKYREALATQGLDLPQEASPDQLKQVLAATTAHNQSIIKKLELKINPE
jgi:tripartite-type tricarboxylate transporter receptor subunit TctC